MATYGQIANDLDAQAALFKGRGQDTLVKSLLRGATAIRELNTVLTKAEVEQNAMEEQLKRYRNAQK